MTGIILSLFLIQSFEKRLKEDEVDIKNIGNFRESDFAKQTEAKPYCSNFFKIGDSHI